MLVPIIFIVALMVTLAGAVLESSLLTAKTALQTSVARSSDIAITDGVADFTTALANYVQQYGTAGPWPEAQNVSFPRALCVPASTAAQCPFSYVVTGHVTHASSAGSNGGGADPASNLQSSAIDEQRISAVVTVTITSAQGTLLGTRTRLLTYRVFGAAPYAVIAGVRDVTTTDGSRSAAQGDSGGATPGTSRDTAAADTRIHVVLSCNNAIQNIQQFTNDSAAVGNDGLPWGNNSGGAHEVVCKGGPSPADKFSDETWTNGDVNNSGWTQ